LHTMPMRAPHICRTFLSLAFPTYNTLHYTARSRQHAARRRVVDVCVYRGRDATGRNEIVPRGRTHMDAALQAGTPQDDAVAFIRRAYCASAASRDCFSPFLPPAAWRHSDMSPSMQAAASREGQALPPRLPVPTAALLAHTTLPHCFTRTHTRRLLSAFTPHTAAHRLPRATPPAVPAAAFTHHHTCGAPDPFTTFLIRYYMLPVCGTLWPCSSAAPPPPPHSVNLFLPSSLVCLFSWTAKA